MDAKTQGGYYVWDPWSGEEVWIPDTGTTTTTQNKTALDYINSIFSGANSILSQLFPTGLNNTGNTLSPGLYPTNSAGSGGNNNNTLIFLLVGLGVLYFLLKDKK